MTGRLHGGRPRLRGGCILAAWLALTFVGQADTIILHWEGLPSGVTPQNTDVYFQHNWSPYEKKYMGELEENKIDVWWNWGGYLHVPYYIEEAGGRHFYKPFFSQNPPGSFSGKSLTWNGTDASTGDVELGDDPLSSWDLYIKYLERFQIVQHYQGIVRTEPPTIWKDENDSNYVLATPKMIENAPGEFYICTGWTDGDGIPAQGTATSLTIVAFSEDVTITWKYERAYPLKIGYLPAGFSQNPNLMIQRQDAGTVVSNALNGTNFFTDSDYTLSVDQSITAGNDRYFCLGYTNGVLGGAVSAGPGVIDLGRVKVNFTLDRDCQLDFVYEFQNKLTIAVDPALPQSVRDGSTPSPTSGVHWFMHDASVTARVLADFDDPGTGFRWHCTGWTNGSGSVSSAGTTSEVTFVLSAMSAMQWQYKKVLTYSVLFNGLPESLQSDTGIVPPKGANYFLLGETPRLSAPKIIYYGTPENAEERYVCDGWVGTGDILASGSTTTTTANVTMSSTITWTYHKEYRLKIDIDPPGLEQQAAPTPSGTNWYNPGVQVVASILQTASTQTLVGAVLIGAAEGAASGVNGTRRTRTFNMSGGAQIIWLYKESERWEMGQPITAPAGAMSNEAPAIEIVVPGHADDTSQNTFFFGGPAGNKRLYPIRPVSSALISWNNATGGSPVVSGGYSLWPSNLQRHVGSVPVMLQVAGSGYTPYNVRYAENDANVSNQVFSAAVPGRSLIQYVQGALANPNDNPSRFVAVDTVLWNDSGVLVQTNWPIGTVITNANHTDTNGNGYIFFPKGFYDVSIYRRDIRRGPILSVNKDTARDDDDMVVIWWTLGDPLLKVSWPTHPCRYICQWPDEMGLPIDNIYIASQQGSGPLSPIIYPQGQIYVQSDSTLPGYNPNEEHAAVFDQGGQPVIYALRNDLNAFLGASEPYVLYKYMHPVRQEWAMKVFKVCAEGGGYQFNYPLQAGQPILPPTPISLLMPACDESRIFTGQNWYYRDHKGGHWAKAAGTDTNTALIVMHWYYPLQTGFYYPDYNNDGNPDAAIGDPVPFLNGGLDHNIRPPTNAVYTVTWPTNTQRYAVMGLGETLLKTKVPVFSMAAAEVIYDENLYNGGRPLIKLIDPLSERWVQLAELPADIVTIDDGPRKRFKDLPYYLQSRISYDPLNERLYFGGILDESGVGDPLLLLNVMSLNERVRLQDFNTEWAATIGDLFAATRNPDGIEYGAARVTNIYNSALSYTADQWITLWGEIQLGLQQASNDVIAAARLIGVPKALTAGAAGGTGWVTVVENDDPSLGAAPVALHLIRVEGEPYVGSIKVIEPDNVFDEKLTLRHSGDFGGSPDGMIFEWWYKPDTSGFAPSLPGDDPAPPGGDWRLFASGGGLQEITIEGASPLTLADNWFAVRYNYAGAYPFYTNQTYNSQISMWAGQPGTDRKAQLAEGWIKRVVAGLNPFDARVKDFHAAPVNTVISMIAQLGTRYEGPVAFNGDPQNLNNIGLIETYETVLRRGMQFSTDAGINYGPANTALLNISSRLADFYMMLGNEAYQDAVDPTIGFGTASGEYGTLAPSIFAFQNQVPRMLDEELVLLRGRDNYTGPVGVRPVYNRFFWNFTQGEGEVAYAQAYNISDQVTVDGDQDGYADTTDGVIDEDDAKKMFPQGHGDAWGHYLSAIKYHYNLLQNNNFSWEPRPEAVTVGGAPITIDYMDERKFAREAAARAKVGAEIVNLTYRQYYVDDPSGQWQGYKDTDRDRAWGFDDWARRAGQGAYFDWAAGNAMLPAADPNTNHTGIAKIDRGTIKELRELASCFADIEGQADKADQGLNPLGLAKGVVPFDIDPSLLLAGSYSKTHFEQVYDRALEAMKNAVSVFDYANQLTQMLRRNEDARDDFNSNIEQQERDYLNRLIEIYGYPYADDIGPNGTFPSGYEGPDWVHFMYVDPSELTGDLPIQNIQGYDLRFNFDASQMDAPLGIVGSTLDVNFTFASNGKWIVRPPAWTGQRRAQGEIQRSLSDLILAQANVEKAMTELEQGPLGEIENQRILLETKYNVNLNEIKVKRMVNSQLSTLDAEISRCNRGKLYLNRALDTTDRIYNALVEGLPKVVGLSTDAMAPGRAALWGTCAGIASGLGWGADQFEMAQLDAELDKEVVARSAELELQLEGGIRVDLLETYQAMQSAMGDAQVKMMEISTLKEQVEQAAANYQAVLAKGQRLLEERAAWRKTIAPEIQDYRYQDMTFRVFRNDALQKYRAQFDLAARYVYLAATAYDYETCLLGGENGSGREFLTDIVRQRCLGQMIDGLPMVGRPGLADPLSRMSQNFAVYKTQMGFNNPQTETSRFSLRQELFRIKPSSTNSHESDAAWRNVLEASRVDDLWQLPEFRRFCRPFAPESAGGQPGLVIKFPTYVQFGRNFFGWPLGGGDSTYDPTHFATKVRSVGVWFANYDGQGLSYTPRVYLVPTGADIMRSPSGDTLQTREWKIVDQKIPVPFPLGDLDMQNPEWIPMNDSLSEEFSGIRRYSRFRAYHDSGEFTAAETISDSRLIGRSVWNTQWMLIIPGETLLNPPSEGLDTFIYGRPVAGNEGQRDLNGIKDIKLFFQTYAYSGN